MMETIQTDTEEFTPLQGPVFHNGAFSAEDVERIIAIGEAQPKAQAALKHGGQALVAAERRRTEVSWISFTDETRWLFEQLFRIGSSLNQQYYRYDITGFELDKLQYTVYHGSTRAPGHYDWHADGFNRKLSLVVSLSDPRDFTGGALQITTGQLTNAHQSKGIVNAFPSWMLHRVTPVTRGTRRTLVAWLVGPHFR